MLGMGGMARSVHDVERDIKNVKAQLETQQDGEARKILLGLELELRQ